MLLGCISISSNIILQLEGLLVLLLMLLLLLILLMMLFLLGKLASSSLRAVLAAEEGVLVTVEGDVPGPAISRIKMSARAARRAGAKLGEGARAEPFVAASMVNYLRSFLRIQKKDPMLFEYHVKPTSWCEGLMSKLERRIS